METRIKELEKLFSKIPKEKQDKYFENFSKWATYMGNGLYQWKDILSSDTRELYLLGCLAQEKIPYPKY
jgi:hypothetical protein